MPSQCARCRRRVDRHEGAWPEGRLARRAPGPKGAWPEGRLCKRCYQRATRIHGVCPGCQQQRLLPGLDALRQPICVDCAKIPRDFHCTRCGEEDDPYRRGLCARCCLRDHLAGMLDDGNGRVRPELLPSTRRSAPNPIPAAPSSGSATRTCSSCCVAWPAASCPSPTTPSTTTPRPRPRCTYASCWSAMACWRTRTAT
jgi:hypothetical protein